jgi:Protein of unknown function (DUF3567)
MYIPTRPCSVKHLEKVDSATNCNCNRSLIISTMHTLYDSETYSVTHMLANADTEASTVKTEEHPSGVPVMARHGFEIVDKRSGKEVYLDGSWAELFQQHIMAWQVNIPSQEEVEDTLEQYAELAQNPVLVH